MACITLTSCTLNDTTVLITDSVVSAPLMAYIGQNVNVIGYPGICFYVELNETGCLDCEKAASILLAPGNPICINTIPYRAYILTPCDPQLPSLFTTQVLYPYDGLTITFFGQGGACYTVNGSLTVPTDINSVIVQCPEPCACTPVVCGCPDGYVLNQAGLCEGTVSVPPINNGTQYTVAQALWFEGTFGTLAAEFYEDITNKPWPILSTAPGNVSAYTDNTLVPLLITNTLSNQIWGGLMSSLNFRMRIAGVWTNSFTWDPIDEWIGFSYCVTLTETKTYYIAYAVDDFARIFIDGVLMLNQDTSGWAFKKLQIFPITLNAGLHIITGEVKNAGVSAIFAFEIYDATLAQLLAVALPGDIDPYIVFSSGDQIGLNWQTGETSGYSCPDGYALNTCDGLSCTQIVTIPQVPCEAWQITFCEGTGLDPIITSTDLSGYIGSVYEITYTPLINPIAITACGSVAQAPSQLAPAFTGTFSEISYDCCESCMAICYLLEDCQNAVPDMILCTDLSEYVGKIIKIKGCGDICWTVSEANSCVNSIKFEGEVTEFDTCLECLPPTPVPVPLELNLRKVKPGYNSPNSCVTLEYLQRVNCNFALQVYNEMLIKRYGITVCCDQDVDTWDIQKSELDYMLMGDPSMCKSTLCDCKAPCLIDAIFTLVPTCVEPILISATLDDLCFPPVFTDGVVTVETQSLPCNCYILTGTDYTLGWIDCCCEYQTATFTSNATVCAHYPPVILSGVVAILAAEECGSDLCVAPLPVCYCWNIIPGPGGDQIRYTSCNDIDVIIRVSSSDNISVCSETTPTVINGSTVTNTGFCTTNCGLTPSCVCYQVIITSNDLNPATVDMVTTSCNNPLVPITTTIVSGTPTLLCSGKVPTFTSASANAVINILVKNTIACVDCHIPIPCVCYQVLMPALGGTISYIPCGSTSGYLNVTLGAGWSYHCSESGAPFSISGGAPLNVTAISNDCGLGECVLTPVCNTQTSCYTITNLGAPTTLLYDNCFASYIILNMTGVINICDAGSAPQIGSGTVVLNGPCTTACTSTPTETCQCYRISINTATPCTFEYIDCNGVPATKVITSTGTICAKNYPNLTTFAGGVVTITYSTDNCGLGQCI